MKRFILVLMAVVLFSSSADARWHHGHRHFGHGYYAADVATGIIGTAAGVMLAREILDTPAPRVVQPRVYVVEPEGKCYTIISRKTGQITQKCVERASEEIIYID